MSIYAGPEIVNSGLVLCLDAGNSRSYSGSGSTWYDVSGYDNHATLVNNPTYSTSSNGDFLFDASTQSASANVVFNSSQYSVEWWLKPLTIGGQNSGTMFGTTWGTFIWHIWSGNVIYVGTDIGTRIGPVGNVIFGRWQQWCWTFNNGVGTIYCNGTFVSSKSGMSIIGSPSSMFQIYGNSNRSFVSIYSGKVLSAAEVQQNFNALRGRYSI